MSDNGLGIQVVKSSTKNCPPLHIPYLQAPVSGAESPFTFCSGFVLADWGLSIATEQDNGLNLFLNASILRLQFPKQIDSARSNWLVQRNVLRQNESKYPREANQASENTKLSFQRNTIL